MAKHGRMESGEHPYGSNRSSKRPWMAWIILAWALLLSAGACNWLPFRTEGERPFLAEEGPQRKTVVGKEPPYRLVAVDGTICDVPKERYESVKVEDKVWCAWRSR